MDYLGFINTIAGLVVLLYLVLRFVTGRLTRDDIVIVIIASVLIIVIGFYLIGGTQ